MNPLGSLAAQQMPLSAPVQPPPERDLRLRETFQDFVAGTFYAQMLKSLRKTHGKPAYFHGGQAEEVFQGQLDQQVAEDLARSAGGAFADPLFEAFEQRLRLAPALGGAGETAGGFL